MRNFELEKIEEQYHAQLIAYERVKKVIGPKFNVVIFFEKIKESKIDNETLRALETLSEHFDKKTLEIQIPNEAIIAIKLARICNNVYCRSIDNKEKKHPIYDFHIESEYQLALFSVIDWIKGKPTKAQIRLSIQGLPITDRLLKHLKNQHNNHYAFTEHLNVTSLRATRERSIEDLLSAMLNESYIPKISITSCGLTDNDLSKIAEYIKNNTQLKSLDLCGNLFSEKALNDFSINIFNNISITEIKFTSIDNLKIKEITERNKRIETFDDYLEEINEARLLLGSTTSKNFSKKLKLYLPKKVIKVYRKEEVDARLIKAKDIFKKKHQWQIFNSLHQNTHLLHSLSEKSFNEILIFLRVLHNEKILYSSQVIPIYEKFFKEFSQLKSYTRLFNLFDALSDSLPEFYLENIKIIVKEAMEWFVSAKDFKRAIHFLKALEAKKLNSCDDFIVDCYKLLLKNLGETRLTIETAPLVLLMIDRAPQSLLLQKDCEVILEEAYEVIIKNLCERNQYNNADTYFKKMSKMALPCYQSLLDFRIEHEFNRFVAFVHAAMNETGKPLIEILNDTDLKKYANDEVLNLIIAKLKSLALKDKKDKNYTYKGIAILIVKEALKLLPQQSINPDHRVLDVYKIELKHLLLSAENQRKMRDWLPRIEANRNLAQLSNCVQTIITESKGFNLLFISGVTADVNLVTQLTKFKVEIDVLIKPGNEHDRDKCSVNSLVKNTKLSAYSNDREEESALEQPPVASTQQESTL